MATSIRKVARLLWAVHLSFQEGFDQVCYTLNREIAHFPPCLSCQSKLRGMGTLQTSSFCDNSKVCSEIIQDRSHWLVSIHTVKGVIEGLSQTLMAFNINRRDLFFFHFDSIWAIFFGLSGAISTNCSRSESLSLWLYRCWTSTNFAVFLNVQAVKTPSR